MKTILTAIVGIILLYFSVEISPLDTHRQKTQKFDAERYAKDFYKKLEHEKGIELGDLMKAIDSNKAEAFGKFSNSSSIGNIRYFLVETTGTITNIGENEATLKTPAGDVVLATEFIYGAALRDASGIFQIKDFPVAAEVQALTQNINQLAREEVIPEFRKVASLGQKWKVLGAIELNQTQKIPQTLEILPIKLKQL